MLQRPFMCHALQLAEALQKDPTQFADIVAEVQSAPARPRIPRMPRANPLPAGQLMLLGSVLATA